MVHNLARLAWDEPHAPVESWAAEFDRWVWDRVQRNDLAGLANYRSAAPHADLAVPTSEHFDPLFVALGASASDRRSVEIYAGFRHGNLSMRSFLRES